MQIKAFEEGMIKTQSGEAVQARMFKDVMAAMDVLMKRAAEGETEAEWILGDLLTTPANTSLFEETRAQLGSELLKFIDGDGNYIKQAQMIIADVLFDDDTVAEGPSYRLDDKAVQHYLNEIGGRLPDGYQVAIADNSCHPLVFEC